MNDNNIVSPIVDHRFQILSYEQYLLDLPVKKFSKICMTEIINADMMIATFGEDQYLKSCREILQMGNRAYEQLGLDKIIYVYIHSYKHFMAVANDDMSDEDFLAFMKKSHEQYELATSQETSLGGISRFALAFGDHLVDRVKSAYYVNRKLQNNFIVASDERERLAAETEHNVKIFELLNYALSNKKVVPFYQGIRNNQTGTIDKYEALMRIYDQHGHLYPPGLFLEAAKRLKLYLPLSKMLLDRALTDFENKTSELSLNISLFDIQSAEFKEWFLQRLRRHPSPSRITIEFVETENYNNDILIGFLTKVKDIGCKIAVDDFGVGFATYSSIISLRPNIIKIDGDIIKNLLKNDDNNIILESVCYMARLINSDIVAEFVENSSIQDLVLQHEIHHSQGYYFAKPQPLHELCIK